MRVNYTPEEEKHIIGIFEKYRDKIDAATGEARTQLIVRQDEELEAYFDACEQKRFDELGGDPDKILANAQETVYDLVEWHYEAQVSQFPAEDLVQLGIAEIQDGVLRLSDLFMADALRDELRLHIYALKNDEPRLHLVYEAIAEAATSTQYTFPAKKIPIQKAAATLPQSVLFKKNMPMYHGKATDALAAFGEMDLIKRLTDDRAVFETSANGGIYKVVIQGFSKQKGFSVNTHKLFSVGIAEFTARNHYGGNHRNNTVLIPLAEYSRRLGYKVDEAKTDTPEQAAKEKKRAAEAAKKARQRIRQDLELLQSMRWTWQEKVRGKAEDFESIILLEKVAIRKGYIVMEFGRNFSDYLTRLPETQYHQGMLLVDARNENAYRIGLKMTEHFSMDNNQVKGTANRLKVSTLLAATSLPTLEALQNEVPDDSRHWDRRIKEPFERALDELTGKVISDWQYVMPKGKPLPDEDAYISDYETFTGLLVQFALIDAPDHTDRLARRAEEKEAATKAASKKKRSKRDGA